MLQNRRERLEELTLEAQEMRAKRDLTKIQREEQEEEERREAEAQTRQEEAARRQAEIEIERERLEFEKAQERTRREREQAMEREKREVETELVAFTVRWMSKAREAISNSKYSWLSAAQRKEVLEGLEAEIEERDPVDEPRMAEILARTLEALVEPLKVERDAQERRQEVTRRALWSLAYNATEEEKARATAAIRDALRLLDRQSDETEMRMAAQKAVKPVCQAVEKRLLDARLLDWAIIQLPWDRTESDKLRIRRECSEILAELPLDISEAEAKEAMEPTIREVREEIEKKQADKARKERKDTLIQQGLAEISTYLAELEHEDEISEEDYLDPELTASLSKAVRSGLESELSGDETALEVRHLTREIIDEE